MNDSGKGEHDGRATQSPEWEEADSPDNPFGVPLVSLMCNLQLLSSSGSASNAERALSWRSGDQERLSVIRVGDGIPCDLSYPAASQLPDGMLFLPKAMEDKWVIAWRDGAVVFAHSWLGETMITADAVFDGSKLRISRLYLSNDSVAEFGDPVTVVDWMMRTHALDERLALPVDRDTALTLFKYPARAMVVFGHRLFCAGIGYSLPPAVSKLISLGDLAVAVHKNDADAIRSLACDSAWRTPIDQQGEPPLAIASLLGYTGLCRLMLELGADVEARDWDGNTALLVGIAGKCSVGHVKMLVDAGADIHAVNNDGFSAAHCAAEVNLPDIIPLLRDLGANFEAETNKGCRPIHIAAAHGHKAAAEALLNCRVDVKAHLNGQSVLQIAEAEGKVGFASWFAKALECR